MSDRVLVVIQARSGSKRLPGKALLPIAGVPMLAYLIRRLKVLPASYKRVVATTENAGDDIIANLAERENVAVVRGEEDDVLSRYMRCVRSSPCDMIVRVTGDNPLTDPRAVQGIVELMVEGGYDYVKVSNGYPLGAGADVFTAKSLQICDRNTVSRREREHINAYILDHPNEFKIGELPLFLGPDYSDIRLTVDTQGDYESVKSLIESFKHDSFIEVKDAVERIGKGSIGRKISA